MKERTRYASVGYCPWIGGRGRVLPWTPVGFNSEPNREELQICAGTANLSFQAIDSIIKCCDAVDRRGGRPREGTTQEQMTAFQEGVFLDVFGVRDPDFSDFNADLTLTAVPVRRFYPYQRE